MIRSFLVAIGVLMSFPVFCQDLLNGLIVHYPMNGNAQDIGPHGLHGTVSGAVLGVDEDGNANGAYYFNGVNNFIDFPSDPLLKPDFPFTVAVIVKYDNVLILQDAHVFTTDFTQNNYHGAFSSIVGQKQTINFGGGAGNTNPQSRRTKTGTTSLISGQWYRMTFILRGATDMEIYLDCVNDGGSYSGSGPVNIVHSTVPGSLGRMDTDYWGPSNYFKGAISDFRMWDRELTEEDITYLCAIEQPCNLSVDLGHDTTLCEGDVFTLDVSDVNGQYLWQDGATGSSIQVVESGVYAVTVTTDGCNATDSISVLFATPPLVSLGADTVVCDSVPFVLNLELMHPVSQVSWSTGESTPQGIIVTESGQYWVAVEVHGCPPVSDTVNVLVYEGEPFQESVSICEGQSIEIGMTFSDAAYVWNTGESSAFIEVSHPGVYSVDITLGDCMFAGAFTIEEIELPVLGLISDTTHCFVEHLTLFTGLSGYHHLWSDGTHSDSLTVHLEGIYSVEVTVDGCTVSDTVIVSDAECDLVFIMPTVFTPNDDGVNDLFSPISAEHIVAFEFKVFNRWGLLLFESIDVNMWWDGRTQSGARAADGTYFWTAFVTEEHGGKKAFHGTVTLLQ